MEFAVIPKFILRRLSGDEEIQLHLNIILSSILVISLFLFNKHIFTFTNKIPHFCLSKALISTPCPGCGITTSLYWLLKFNLTRSWSHNPAGVFLALFFIIQIPLRTMAIIARGLGGRISRISRITSNVLLIGLLLVWLIKIMIGGN